MNHEMKCGRITVVWTYFLKSNVLISFIINDKIIGIGKPQMIFKRLMGVLNTQVENKKRKPSFRTFFCG